MEHNISEPVEIDGAVENVLHFASPASPVDYLAHPIPTLKVGSLGTHNALGLAKAKNAQFLLASTSEVYGDPEIHPQREDYWGNVNPIGPRGCYDEAKRFAEAITMAYHRFHGVKTHIVRIFNTYGPRMRLNDGRVLPNFINQALHGEPITIYGKGEQTRSFCYVSDLVEGIYRLLKVDHALPVNLGNPSEITVHQLALEIIALVEGTKSKIVYHDLPEDDPKRRRPDITKAQTLLGWNPTVDRGVGFRKDPRVLPLHGLNKTRNGSTCAVSREAEIVQGGARNPPRTRQEKPGGGGPGGWQLCDEEFFGKQSFIVRSEPIDASTVITPRGRHRLA